MKTLEQINDAKAELQTVIDKFDKNNMSAEDRKIYKEIKRKIETYSAFEWLME